MFQRASQNDHKNDNKWLKLIFYTYMLILSIWFNVVSHAKTDQLSWKSILISIASYKVILSSFGQISWFKTMALFWWSLAHYRAEKLEYVENCTRARWELIRNWDNDLEEFKGQFWQCIVMQIKWLFRRQICNG